MSFNYLLLNLISHLIKIDMVQNILLVFLFNLSHLLLECWRKSLDSQVTTVALTVKAQIRIGLASISVSYCALVSKLIC